MTSSGDEGISFEAFRMLAEQAGLGMSQEELEELKPMYELYIPYLRQLHSLDLQAEEIAVAFHPGWPD